MMGESKIRLKGFVFFYCIVNLTSTFYNIKHFSLFIHHIGKPGNKHKKKDVMNEGSRRFVQDNEKQDNVSYSFNLKSEFCLSNDL